MPLAASLSPWKLAIFLLISFPDCNPRLYKRNLYSPPCSAIITLSSAIPTKKSTPPPPIHAPPNFSVCQNAPRYCASARSFIPPKALSSSMSWDFIVPIGTTSSSADIDSWNASSPHLALQLFFTFQFSVKKTCHFVCVSIRFRKKFGVNSSSAANPAAAHPLFDPSISYRAT